MGSLTSQVSLCPAQRALAPTTEMVSERLGDGATSGTGILAIQFCKEHPALHTYDALPARAAAGAASAPSVHRFRGLCSQHR